MPNVKKAKIPNFEKALSSLEELVENLEDGDLALEDALNQYEKGIKLAKECQFALKSAELRVKTLMEENNQILGSLSDSEMDE